MKRCGDTVTVREEGESLVITVNGRVYTINPGSVVACDPNGLGIMIDGELCAFPRSGGGGDDAGVLIKRIVPVAYGAGLPSVTFLPGDSFVMECYPDPAAVGRTVTAIVVWTAQENVSGGTFASCASFASFVKTKITAGTAQAYIFGREATVVWASNSLVSTNYDATNTGTGINQIVIGNGARSKQGTNNVVIGPAAKAGDQAAPNAPTGNGEQVSIGSDTLANGLRATALGSRSSATGLGSLALGDRAVANGLRATALGALANATAIDAVALGPNTTNNVANTVSIGSDTIKRRLRNVAPPEADDEATTLKYVTDNTVKNDGGIMAARRMTQAAYDALAVKDPDTLYVIRG